MIAGDPHSSHGRRRSLDADINLVPFIDLLSMCICFLLMTAIWVQIGALEVKQSQGTLGAASTALLEIDLRFTGLTALSLTITQNSKAVHTEKVNASSLEELVRILDKNLDSLILSSLKEKDRTSLGSVNFEAGKWISSAFVTPHPDVPYGNMVQVMDVLRKHKILNLGVVPVGGAT